MAKSARRRRKRPLDGLRLLREAGAATGLPVVTEVMSPEEVDLVADHANMLQVGARNMQNYPLLRRLARTGRPVLLKRGLSATLGEWLLAAEYLLAGGNSQVGFCSDGPQSLTLEGFAELMGSLNAAAARPAGRRRASPPAARAASSRRTGCCASG